MDEHEIKSKLFMLLEEYDAFPNNNEEEKLAYRYLDNAHIDSIGIINFIIKLETTFSIELTPEDTQSDLFRTPGGLLHLIQNKLS
jgi:acyl carrier protein